MTDKFVLHQDTVYKVEIDTIKMFKLHQYGVDFQHDVWVEAKTCTEITKEVADCMVACDPPMMTYRYATGWSDPNTIYK